MKDEGGTQHQEISVSSPSSFRLHPSSLFPMPPGRNILLFHAGALGDFVLTWPLALALARLHPQSRLFYVTQRGKGALAERVLRVESADSDAGWHPLFAAGASGPGEAP